MMWDDYAHPMQEGMTWATGLVLALLMVLFLAALAVLAFALYRGTANTAQQQTRDRRPGDLSTAERVLAERYARGELDDDEYRRRRDVLRGP